MFINTLFLLAAVATVSLAANFPNATGECSTVDVTMLIDSSQSIRRATFDSVKAYSRQYIERLNVGSGEGEVRVGMIVFNDVIREEWTYKTHSDKNALLAAVDDIKFYTGTTDMQLAFLHALTQLLEARPTACRTVIVFSDGWASMPTSIAEYMRVSMNTSVLAVAVDGINGMLTPYNLENLAMLTGDEKLVFPLSTLTTLQRTMMHPKSL